ncbi:MAG: alpha/beta hydrolase [Rickettsiales bacterium]
MRLKLKALVSLIGSLWVSSCTVLGFAYLNFPADKSTLKIDENIAYGNAAHQKLDIYRPTAAKGNQPVILYFYGGGWTMGSKDDYLFMADTLAKQGFIVVIPDYVKYPEAKFPTFIEDAAQATEWTYQHIAEYGGDPKNMHILGHSAGGHMGALLVSDPRYLKGKIPIRSFVGLAGPYSFTPKEEIYKKIFGPPENYPNMQVTTFITGKEPPMLLLYGGKDDVVGQFNMEKLSEAIRAKGGVVETKIYPKLGHIDIMTGFSPAWKLDEPVVEDTISFFKTHSN